MFGKIMYYDKKMIEDYSSVINGQRPLKIDEYRISNDKGIAADLKFISGDAKASKEYTAKVMESMLYDCAEFEKKLVGRDDFFDFTQSSNFDINTIGRGNIIKFDSFASIPESFDIMQLIDQFKPMLMASMDTEEIDQSGKEALKSFLCAAKATKIPLVLELDDFLLTAKINKDNLICEYEEIEEFEEQQVTVIARVASGIIHSSKAYFDPLKDFMSMGRMMRRSIDNKSKELKPLYLDQEYKQIDILAIYQ